MTSTFPNTAPKTRINNRLKLFRRTATLTRLNNQIDSLYVDERAHNMRYLMIILLLSIVTISNPSNAYSQINQNDIRPYNRISTIHQASGVCGLFPPLTIPPVSTVIVPNLVALIGSAEGLKRKSDYLAYGIVGIVTGPINIVVNLGLLAISAGTISSCGAEGIGLTTFNVSMIALGLTTSIVSGLKVSQVKKMRAPKPKEYSPFVNWPKSRMSNIRIHTLGSYQ